MPRNLFITAFADLQNAAVTNQPTIPDVFTVAARQETSDKLADIAALPSARREPSEVGSAENDPTWLVQLASGRKMEASQWESNQLMERHAALIGKLPARIEEAKLDIGTFYRVQFGPLRTQGEAAALCERLESANQDCLVVQPSNI